MSEKSCHLVWVLREEKRKEEKKGGEEIKEEGKGENRKKKSDNVTFNNKTTKFSELKIISIVSDCCKTIRQTQSIFDQV